MPMQWKQGGQLESAPVGSHIARAIHIIDLGHQPHTNPKTGEKWMQRDVRIVWEMPNAKMEGLYKPELKGKPFAQMVTVKQSLHPAAKLRKLLESWGGRKMDNAAIEAFIPKKMLSKACRLNLIQNGDFVNIDSIAPLSKDEVCPEQINPSIYFSLEPDEFDPKVFAGLTEKTRTKIAASPEYKKLTGAVDDSPAGDGGEPSDDDNPF